MTWTPINSVSFAWPAILLSQGLVRVSNGGPDWGIATKAAVSNGFFRDLRVIDSAGREHRIAGCELRSEPFWRRPKTPLGRLWRIDKLLVEECRAPAFDDVRDRVVRAVEAATDFWESETNADELSARLRAAKNVVDLMKAFHPVARR